MLSYDGRHTLEFIYFASFHSITVLYNEQYQTYSEAHSINTSHQLPERCV